MELDKSVDRLRTGWLRVGTLMLVLALVAMGSLSCSKRATTTGDGSATTTSLEERSLLPFVNHLAVDLSDAEHLFLGTQDGVFISQDGGRTWKPSNQGLRTLSVTLLAPDYRNTDVLWAATLGGGVYRSADSGASWQALNEGISNTTINEIVFHPTQKATVFAVSMHGGVFKSTDNGRSWQPFNQGLEAKMTNINATFFFHLGVVPGDQPVLILGTTMGTFRRPDGSARWEEVGGFLKTNGINSLAYLPNNKTVVAGAPGGVHVSSDGGRTWQPKGSGLEKDIVYYLTSDPADENTIYAVAPPFSGVIKSADQGETWQKINEGIERTSSRILIRLPGERNKFLTVTGERVSRIFETEDGGASWTEREVKQFPDVKQVHAQFQTSSPSKPAQVSTQVRRALVKCNRCHGWTEADLNTGAQAVWRVVPTRRDWTVTVERMNKLRAGLTPEEEKAFARYLNDRFSR